MKLRTSFIKTFTIGVNSLHICKEVFGNGVLFEFARFIKLKVQFYS